MEINHSAADKPRRSARDLMHEDASGQPLTEEQAAGTPAAGEPGERDKDPWLSASRLPKIAGVTLLIVALLALVGFYGGRLWLRSSARNNLPQLDGSLAVPGLHAQVTVERDARGAPHIAAQTIDDLVFAQGFVTASDRLFQMDLLRRHAAGELAEVLGSSAVGLDRLQRTLQVRAAADRAVPHLPAAQLHLLEVYAAGVNASMAAQSGRLPVEFKALGYKPKPWTPRDSLLVELQMFQDLTTSFPVKLARAALTERLPPELVADLYPVGSWRDHPPTAPVQDLTIEGPPIEQVPLDESQSSLRLEQAGPGFAAVLPEPMLVAGSNNWVVSGAHTASGKPMLSNDMHLSQMVPGIWYEADLAAKDFHAAGVSMPGLPLIVVGHNAHIAWGFTNTGADVQDVYVEELRGTAAEAQFRAVDGTWQPLVHLPEVIRVRGGRDVTLDVTATRHGGAITPILNPALPTKINRSLALRWTVYDPDVLRVPTYEVNAAKDWPSFLAAMSQGGFPSQNAVYADDQGHIGYHMVGSIPVRGAGPMAGTAAASGAAALPADVARALPGAARPSSTIAALPDPLKGTGIQAPELATKVPMDGIRPVPETPMAMREWTGYIPFAQLPQVFDPAGGVIATANSRTTPDDYSYPITLNWAEPYRNERIWKTLGHRKGLTPGDLLALEDDVYSEFDHVLAERLAYALDNELEKPIRPLNQAQEETLRQAADLLRTFNGRMTIESPAAAVVASVHGVLWPMLLAPHVQGVKSAKELRALYLWGEEDYALEQVMMHTPPRWLPKGYHDWNDFLTGAIEAGLTEAHAPADLRTWRYGAIHVLDIEHPIFAQSPLLQRIFGLPTGTGVLPQSGDGTTVKQVGRSFGPSERMTVDLGNLDRTTLNLVLGQSGNPVSPWYMDQFAAWYRGTTFAMPFGKVNEGHRLVLTPG